MASLYLFALVVGGGLLLFSLFTGDADAGEIDAGEIDAGVDAEVDAEGELRAGGSGLELTREFLSVRSLLYFLAAFGATGFLLRTLAGAGSLASLAWAAATGILVASMAALVYGWLRRTESGLVPLTNDHLVGLAAQVLVPVRSDHRGKVLAVRDGRQVELLARLYGPADPDCPAGSTVVIVEVEGDTALVTPASYLPRETQ